MAPDVRFEFGSVVVLRALVTSPVVRRRGNDSSMLRQKRHRAVPRMSASILAEPLERRLLLAGVTLITHGYEPTSDLLPGWVTSMATAVAETAGPDSAIYDLRIALNTLGVAQVMSFAQVSGPTFSESSDGQAVI